VVLSISIPRIRNPIVSLFRSPMIIVQTIKREIGGFIFFHKNLIENEKLKREGDFLRSQLNETRECVLENRRLTQLLSLKQKVSYKAVAARVIGRDPSNWESAVIIDKGKNFNIKKGYVAVTFLGLAGKVVEVGSAASKVMLINDPNFAVSAFVQRSRYEGLVSGSLGNSLMMKYLSKDSDVKTGDMIVTSGLTVLFPKGLLIGQVREVGEEFSELSRYAVIKPAVNLAALEEVLIIIP